MNRRLTLALAALALLVVTPPAAASPAPPSFAGISPQSPDSATDFALMRSSGVTSVRLPMYWSGIQPENRFVSRPDFGGYDREVKLAAEHGIRVLPFIFSTPEWVAPDPRTLPVASAWERWAWTAFLRDAVDRYGPEGSFWEENPDVPYLPIRSWEIWNEENIITFAWPPSPTHYAELLRISGRVLHAADPGSKVILGGLFGRPLQVPPNVPPGAFMTRLYRDGSVKQFFDGVALHPYVADASAIRGQILNLRRVMRVHHDSGTGIYVTELGWGSDSYESRWERGLRGQARELNDAMAMLVANRRAWRIDGVWWFSWADQKGGCQFCDSAGLLTEDREAKPAWYRFNAWTGGDPGTVPRANFGD
jgi:hypothetical protein